MLFTKFFKPYLPSFIFGMLVLITETMLDLVQPLMLSKLIDEGIAMSDLEKVKVVGLTMVGLALLQLCFGFVRNYLSTHVSFSFSRDVRQSLYEHMLKLEMTDIEEVERGSMINRLTFDVRQIQMVVSGSMRFFIRVPLFAVGGLIMVAGLGPRFVLLYLSSVPIVIVILMINIKYGFPRIRRIQKQLDNLNKKTIEYLNGIRVVKAFNRTAYENTQFEKVNEQLSDVSISAGVFSAIFNPIISMIVNMAVIFGIYISSQWIFEGTAGVGQVVAFINYMGRLVMAMASISHIFNMYIRGRTSGNRIVDIFNIPIPDQSSPVTIQSEDIEKGLSVENLSFRYGEGENTLEGISFALKGNESLGIIGTTGSGKSTLIHLLAGLLKPTEGVIKIGDQVLCANSTKSFRQWLGYVPQDKILFSDTVVNNICFDQSDLTNENKDEVSYDQERLMKALDIAQADFVHEMEDGIKTKLGKGGVNISGGQKQRISIARALYKKPKLLLLDDSTSALDAVTEKRVFEKLKESNEGVSMIVVGQKIATVSQMDQIMVLHKGTVAGIGKHETLLETCKPYQDLYQAQMGVSV